ncbi:polysaccharide biosynthesis protein [Marinobacter zhejiangensis]|uniref:Exopolysaccharide/PEP-CTERM locus tyrosine autokinase n=1 Tax=Marinobacter zhejiangensis TaxID=488535 RepID=A0A1I4RMY8_9GAMM|nr:polysaccharide biosynthesis protein [Marinobacter zhejiangensis]SFM53350.1 exopolysaccharide/PEP-CTERM locus tyrosine autokinase [Marinobacter zhejiangensis]
MKNTEVNAGNERPESEDRLDQAGGRPEDGEERFSSDSANSGEDSTEENRQTTPFTEWDDSRLLVPSSLELGHGSVDKYLISKQISQMREPRVLTPDDLDERRIIYPNSPNRKLVNRFRNLRTQLMERSNGNNFTLVVSGATPGSGASFVALNLAAAFAFDRSKTALLVDCNLREPSLHNSLDIMTDSGLTDFLEDPDYDISRIIYPTGIPRLRLIPAGSQRETPSEFFTSFRMKQFMQAVRKRYPDRFIVLDTASISESPDARILSEICDYSMLVVPHGRATVSGIEQASMGFNPEKLVGMVING